jgi:hypothetical protein
MKKQNLILTLMSINTVFANSLPPTPDYECHNSLPPCIEGKKLEFGNSLPPTYDYVASVQKPTRIERQTIEASRLKRLKMFEQRTMC